MEKIKELLEQQHTAFEHFKTANDARLSALEKHGSADPLLEGKVDRANEEISKLAKQLEELGKQSSRPGWLKGGSNADADSCAKGSPTVWKRWSKRRSISPPRQTAAMPFRKKLTALF
jgi:HK97 family phage major capsid protein